MERVLFLCVHNSARSQMAEGMLRAWGGGDFDAHSAGNEATEVRPQSFIVMAELGIDITGQRSKTVHDYDGQFFDRVITVCSDAVEACPYFPGAGALEHWDLEDPAAVKGSESEQQAAFRRVRDAIAERVRGLVDRV